MSRIASIALTAALGVAGIAGTVQADPGLPEAPAARPLIYADAYYAPFYYTRARYDHRWHRGYGWDRHHHFHRDWRRW
jgi:hypothetical protein